MKSYKSNKIFLFLLIFITGFFTLNAQKFDHYKKIAEFSKSDIENPPQLNGILLIGSSSFTFWQDVHDYFPDRNIINRGFGGSTFLDLIYIYRDIVPVYKPKQIVIYCGENDLAFDESLSSCEVLSRFKVLYNMIRIDFGDNVNVSYISMKPCPIRAHLMNRFEKANILIKDFLSSQSHANYIDIYPHMLDNEGKPDPSLFLDDLLHNNKKGYQIWKNVMEDFLIETNEF